MCVCVSSIFFPLVVVEASPYLNYWDHSLPEFGFRVHDSATGVSQASLNTYTLVDLSCEGIPEKALRLTYIFLFFSFMGGPVMFG